MVSKCANPSCSAPFQYLRDGKLFRIELDQADPPEAKVVAGSRKLFVMDNRPGPHRVEHFWLCGACAALYTLGLDKGRVITLLPLQAEARRAAAS